jgi:hypothetical protein
MPVSAALDCRFRRTERSGVNAASYTIACAEGGVLPACAAV